MKVLLLTIIISFTAASCEKNSDTINIQLRDKPLSEIREAIQGKWQFHYAYGGFTGHYRYNYINSFITFHHDHVTFRNGNTDEFTDTITYWKRIKDIFGDSTYLMTINGQGWIVDGIYSDTLVLIDNAYDGMAHFLTIKRNGTSKKEAL